MEYATVELPNGLVWTPRFAATIDAEKCIGCGRCYKVCGRNVLMLAGLTEEGEVVAYDEDDDDEYEKKVMTIQSGENCIGCEACARICPRSCYTHAALEMAK